MGAIGSALLLAGCGGGDTTTGTAPNEEVEIVAPVDAQGKAYTLEDEAPLPQ